MAKRVLKSLLPTSDLTESQTEIMEIVWDRGEVSALEVREVLCKQRDVARNTIRTLLGRMEAKGWLKHRLDGRTFLYSATIARQKTIAQKVIQLLDDVCGGSAETLVAALVDHRKLTSSELDRVAEILAEAQAERDRQAKPRKKGKR